MSSSDLVQSVDRALRAVAAVAQRPAGRSLRDLADDLALKPTTLYNLLRTLVAHRWLTKVGSPPVYRLGAAPAELAAAADDAVDAPVALVRRVAARCPWADVLWVEEIDGAMPVVLRIGTERPGVVQRPRREFLSPYSSASCLALQAFGPAERLAAIRARHPFAEAGRGEWRSLARLDAFLARTRRAGICLPPDNGTALFRAAVPLYDEGGGLRGVIGASGRELSRARQRNLVAALRRVAAS